MILLTAAWALALSVMPGAQAEGVPRVEIAPTSSLAPVGLSLSPRLEVFAGDSNPVSAESSLQILLRGRLASPEYQLEVQPSQKVETQNQAFIATLNLTQEITPVRLHLRDRQGESVSQTTIEILWMRSSKPDALRIAPSEQSWPTLGRFDLVGTPTGEPWVELERQDTGSSPVQVEWEAGPYPIHRTDSSVPTSGWVTLLATLPRDWQLQSPLPRIQLHTRPPSLGQTGSKTVEVHVPLEGETTTVELFLSKLASHEEEAAELLHLLVRYPDSRRWSLSVEFNTQLGSFRKTQAGITTQSDLNAANYGLEVHLETLDKRHPQNSALQEQIEVALYGLKKIAQPPVEFGLGWALGGYLSLRGPEREWNFRPKLGVQFERLQFGSLISPADPDTLNGGANVYETQSVILGWLNVGADVLIHSSMLPLRFTVILGTSFVGDSQGNISGFLGGYTGFNGMLRAETPIWDHLFGGLQGSLTVLNGSSAVRAWRAQFYLGWCF